MIHIRTHPDVSILSTAFTGTISRHSTPQHSIYIPRSSFSSSSIIIIILTMDQPHLPLAEQDTPPPPVDEEEEPPPQQQHSYTQILDLTHPGTGTTATITSFAQPTARTQPASDEDDEEEEEVAMAPAAATNSYGTTTTSTAKLSMMTTPHNTHIPNSSSSFNPHTPGRVVETGKEHTGRWTKHEHDAFLEG